MRFGEPRAPPLASPGKWEEQDLGRGTMERVTEHPVRGAQQERRRKRATVRDPSRRDAQAAGEQAQVAHHAEVLHQPRRQQDLERERHRVHDRL